MLGAPGTGKSTYAAAIACELGRLPAYVFAHDIGFKIPDKLPDGRETRVVRLDNVGAARARVASDPRGMLAISCIDASEVTEIAQQTADASLRANGGTHGVPAVCLIDEIVAAADANPYRLGTPLKHTLMLRRHRNVAIVWTCQSPRLAHYQLMCAGTSLVVFRLKGSRDLEELRKCGFTEEEIRTVTELPNYHYIVHSMT